MSTGLKDSFSLLEAAILFVLDLSSQQSVDLTCQQIHRCSSHVSFFMPTRIHHRSRVRSGGPIIPYLCSTGIPLPLCLHYLGHLNHPESRRGYLSPIRNGESPPLIAQFTLWPPPDRMGAGRRQMRRRSIQQTTNPGILLKPRKIRVDMRLLNFPEWAAVCSTPHHSFVRQKI
jgi:hypothetical protein